MRVLYGIQCAARVSAWAAALVAAVSLMLMMLQTVLDIVLTQLLARPIEGNLEVISYYHMVLVVFLPLALVELKHEHIHVDLFISALPRRAQNIIYVIASTLAAVFVGMLFYQTLADAISAWKISEVVMGSIPVPIWPARWALPIGFAALVLALIANAGAALSDLDGYSPNPQAPQIE